MYQRDEQPGNVHKIKTSVVVSRVKEKPVSSGFGQRFGVGNQSKHWKLGHTRRADLGSNAIQVHATQEQIDFGSRLVASFLCSNFPSQWNTGEESLLLL